MKKKVLLLVFAFMAIVQVAKGQSGESSQDTYKSKVVALLELGGSEKIFKTVVVNIIDMYQKQYSTNETAMAFLEKFKDRKMQESLDELGDMLVPIYKKHLTEEDLDGMIAFYKTDLGRKMVEKTPEIMQESMEIGQLWGRKIAEEIASGLKEEE